MRAVSAADSVSLAVQRTREFLFNPFNWGTYLKLGLVAIVTEGVGENFSSSSHGGGGSTGQGPSLHAPFSFAPELVAECVAALLLALVLMLFVFYLITRLRFAFFHCLVTNTREIRPGWRLYRTQAKRFFWMNLWVGLCFLLLLAVVALPFVAGFWRLFQENQHGGHLNVGLLLSLILPLIPLIFLIALAGFMTDVILRDCMLPHYALEDATAGRAWSQAWSRIKAEKGHFFVYALLRLVLPIVASAALFILLLIPGLVLVGLLATVEYSLHAVFADATGASAVTGILLQVFFGAIALGFAVLASVCLGGPVSTAVREYALVFYGGRYEALGSRLYPAAPPLPPPLNGAPELA
jgi:hypothetical protein